jgi:flagellar biosynthesis/type III secretory pathway M-ring protein FliF/YscJ
MLDITAFAESFVPLGRLVLSGVIIAYMWPKLVRTYRETKVNAATKRAMDRYSGALAPDEEEDIAQRLADKLRS